MNSANPSPPPRLGYDCELSQLPPRFARSFVQLERDPSVERFLRLAETERHGAAIIWLHRALRPFLSDYDINGLLGTYRLFLLSTEQWQQLLPPLEAKSLLDVGAGAGDVTASLAPLFDSVSTIETSRMMARRLRRRGYRCFRLDVAIHDVPEAPYDVISCLNVLDRCPYPRRLLRRLRAALKPGGLLIVALVLPTDPFYYRGGRTLPPLEALPCTQAEFESAARCLIEEVLEPLGLELVSFCRAPYLSLGDTAASLYRLDDVVVVCRAT